MYETSILANSSGSYIRYPKLGPNKLYPYSMDNAIVRGKDMSQLQSQSQNGRVCRFRLVLSKSHYSIPFRVQPFQTNRRKNPFNRRQHSAIFPFNALGKAPLTPCVSHFRTVL